jgi:hypothetical protein
MGALAYLHEHGLDAETLMGDQIEVWPEESITPAMECWIIEHKAQLVTEMRRSGHTPDAVLLEIAQTLQADVHRLRALLSDDDMQDIAEGHYSWSYLLAYFRLMRSDGKSLADDELLPAASATENLASNLERMESWKPAHDAMINHLLACLDCHAPLSRYCTSGANLRSDYLQNFREAEDNGERKSHD